MAGRGVDAKLTRNAEGILDLTIEFDGDLEGTDSFDTAIEIALGVDGRAAPEDVPEPELRKGWPGDVFTPDDPIGNKLWLFKQSRLTGPIIRAIEDESRKALGKLVTAGYAVDVRNVRLVVTEEEIGLDYDILRDLNEIDRRHARLWDNTGVS